MFRVGFEVLCLYILFGFCLMFVKLRRVIGKFDGEDRILFSNFNFVLYEEIGWKFELFFWGEREICINRKKRVCGVWGRGKDRGVDWGSFFFFCLVMVFLIFIWVYVFFYICRLYIIFLGFFLVLWGYLIKFKFVRYERIWGVLFLGYFYRCWFCVLFFLLFRKWW